MTEAVKTKIFNLIFEPTMRRYFTDNGKKLSISEISRIKDFVTNLQNQGLTRKTYADFNLFNETEYVQHIAEPIEIKGYIPTFGALRKDLADDAKFGTFNHLSTDIMNSHKKARTMLQNLTVSNFYTEEQLELIKQSRIKPEEITLMLNQFCKDISVYSMYLNSNFSVLAKYLTVEELNQYVKNIEKPENIQELTLKVQAQENLIQEHKAPLKTSVDEKELEASILTDVDTWELYYNEAAAASAGALINPNPEKVRYPRNVLFQMVNTNHRERKEPGASAGNIKIFKPVMDADQVESARLEFQKVQGIHALHERRKNGIKKRVSDAIMSKQTELDKVYNIEYIKYVKESEILSAELLRLQNALRQENTKYNAVKLEHEKAVRNLAESRYTQINDLTMKYESQSSKLRSEIESAATITKSEFDKWFSTLGIKLPTPAYAIYTETLELANSENFE